MSKLINVKLYVISDQDHTPIRVRWQGRWLRVVMILERWYDAGKWWEGERPLLFFRIQMEGSRVWEVFYDHEQDSWSLYKVYD